MVEIWLGGRFGYMAGEYSVTKRRMSFVRGTDSRFRRNFMYSSSLYHI